MLEQLRYDMITGLFHHKKRALLVIISVLLTYVFMCFSYRGLINTADFIKLLFSGMSYTDFPIYFSIFYPLRF